MKKASFTLLLALSLGVAWAVAAAPAKQTARPQVGQPVEAAEQLVKQKKLKEALAKLAEADAVPDKSPYEIYIIEATRAVVEIDSADFPAAIEAIDAVLATGMLPPAEALQRRASLVDLAYQTKDYPAVVTYAQRYYEAGGEETGPRLLMAQAYYLQNDFADAARVSQAVLQDEQKSGKPPSEAVLQMLASSDYKQQDQAGYIDAMKELVATHPKQQYWVELLAAVRRRPGFAGRLVLDLDRLSAAVGAMDRADQYMEGAQLALEAGLPGDAKTLLDKGYAAGVLGKGADAARQQRLADMAKREAAGDDEGLARLAREAETAANGLFWIKLGDAYASDGRYGSAIEAYQKGIATGGLAHPDDAELHLGLAYLAAKEGEKARATLSAVSAADGARDLAQLWLIESKGE
ncbi:MAG TPA: hypothetical protein VLX85_08650 [Stellaceae bacterium]|nr:hypothetical protein [Stellaceae bacterium]